MVLTAIGALGLPALILPFAWDTTPHEALVDGWLWQLALPASLALLILPASARWIAAGALTQVENAAAYLAAAAALACIALSYTHIESWPDGVVQWVAVVGPVLILGFGAVAFVRNLRAGRPRSYSPILALQVVYIANAMLALASFFPYWQVGAYAVVVTIMAYAIQIDLVRKAPGQPPLS
jgi:hypothetical protein